MTVSQLTPNPQKYKTALLRRRVIERLRLEMVSEQQVLTQLGISRTLLNHWNRTYQRYQRVWWFKPARFPCFTMKQPDLNDIQVVRQQLADAEAALQKERLKNQALETVIRLAEQEFKIPIRKKSGSKR